MALLGEVEELGDRQIEALADEIAPLQLRCRMLFAVAFGCGLLAWAAGGWLARRTIAPPLAEIAGHFRNLSRAGGDLTVTLRARPR
jgi:hypothetical protein